MSGPFAVPERDMAPVHTAAQSETQIAAQPPMSGSRAVLLAVLGLIVGTWSTVCGVGGGIFAVPILHYVFGMPLKMAIGNSLVLVAASTSSATLSEMLRSDASMHWDVIAALVAASLVGTQVGFQVARRLDTLKLKLVFCVVLVIVAAEVLFDFARPAAAPAAVDAVFRVHAIDWVTIGCIGFGAGFVAPMLGVGGGLVAVPALFLGFPTLGYLGARSSSLAMSMFTAWQSVWLYRGDRHVHVPTAAWFSGGAMIGGLVGVMVVHVPGVPVVAQRLLGVTLSFVAVRFAWDVWRAWRTRHTRR